MTDAYIHITAVEFNELKDSEIKLIINELTETLKSRRIQIKFTWRHYKGSQILNEGEVKAPCRVTAKRLVTAAIKETGVVSTNYKSSWIEKATCTVTSIESIKGITHLLSSNKEFILFFDPRDEKEMVAEMTSPKDRNKDLNKQSTLF